MKFLAAPVSGNKKLVIPAALLAADKKEMEDAAAKKIRDIARFEAEKIVEKARAIAASIKANIFVPSHVGRRVEVDGFGTGVIMFVGLHVVNGLPRIGVVLDLPVGINDGTINGHLYFSCQKLHGILADPKLGNCLNMYNMLAVYFLICLVEGIEMNCFYVHVMCLHSQYLLAFFCPCFNRPELT